MLFMAGALFGCQKLSGSPKSPQIDPMKNGLHHCALAAFVLLDLGTTAQAQETHSFAITNAAHERVLRVESVVPAPAQAVWRAFATEAGLKTWMAPVVALDFRVGGSVSTHYNRTATIGSAGAIRLGIVNYLEGEMITLKVNLNGSFAAKPRAEDKNLQELIQMVPLTNGTTKVVSSMVGWGQGKEWDDTFNFFAKGNEWTYRQLTKSFVEKPK
jgi:hypothetical protein